jgi:hypothetical protein
MYNINVPAERAKNAAAVELGRKGGQKGGPARAAKLTAKQRRESARRAAQARWAKAPASKARTSDEAVLKLLKRLKETSDPAKVRELSDRLERAIFHKQYKSA